MITQGESACFSPHLMPDIGRVHDTAAVIRDMDGVYGTSLLAYMLGLTTVATIHDWTRGADMPSERQRRRLAFIHDLTVFLRQGDDDPTIKAWSTGQNPHLSDEWSVADVIHESAVAEDALIRDASDLQPLNRTVLREAAQAAYAFAASA